MKVEIKKMDHMGNGIGYIDDKITFVPKTITGDVVNIEIVEEHKKYCQAKLLDIYTSSSQRIDAFCPYYSICGGCHLQNFSYNDTLAYKKERIQNILKRAGIYTDIIVMPNENCKNYRNKIELKIKNGKMGFYETKSHDVVEISACAIAKQCINVFLDEIHKMDIQNGDVTIRCNYNDELLVVISTKDKVKINSECYSNYKVVGVVLNNETIYGENHFIDCINGYFFDVAYDAFFQVNSHINSKIFDLIEEHTQGQVILDLYSGVGTLSIMASKNAKKVYAIESVPSAVENALKNARMNKANNINFILGKVEDKIKYINDKIDTVIIDPPRQGLDKISIAKILEFRPQNIIYISCETQKFCEDLKALLTNYEVEKIYALDMFSYTYHVECVCLLKLR